MERIRTRRFGSGRAAVLSAAIGYSAPADPATERPRRANLIELLFKSVRHRALKLS